MASSKSTKSSSKVPLWVAVTLILLLVVTLCFSLIPINGSTSLQHLLKSLDRRRDAISDPSLNNELIRAASVQATRSTPLVTTKQATLTKTSLLDANRSTLPSNISVLKTNLIFKSFTSTSPSLKVETSGSSKLSHITSPGIASAGQRSTNNLTTDQPSISTSKSSISRNLHQQAEKQDTTGPINDSLPQHAKATKTVGGSTISITAYSASITTHFTTPAGSKLRVAETTTPSSLTTIQLQPTTNATYKLSLPTTSARIFSKQTTSASSYANSSAHIPQLIAHDTQATLKHSLPKPLERDDEKFVENEAQHPYRANIIITEVRTPSTERNTLASRASATIKDATTSSSSAAIIATTAAPRSLQLTTLQRRPQRPQYSKGVIETNEQYQLEEISGSSQNRQFKEGLRLQSMKSRVQRPVESTSAEEGKRVPSSEAERKITKWAAEYGGRKNRPNLHRPFGQPQLVSTTERPSSQSRYETTFRPQSQSNQKWSGRDVIFAPWHVRQPITRQPTQIQHSNQWLTPATRASTPTTSDKRASGKPLSNTPAVNKDDNPNSFGSPEDKDDTEISSLWDFDIRPVKDDIFLNPVANAKPPVSQEFGNMPAHLKVNKDWQPDVKTPPPHVMQTLAMGNIKATSTEAVIVEGDAKKIAAAEGKQQAPHHRRHHHLHYDADSPVIVTALVDIGRGNWTKYTRTYEQYLSYLDNLLKLKNRLVIYTDKKGAEFVRKKRQHFNTEIFEITMKDIQLYAYREEMQRIIDNEQRDWKYDAKMKDLPEAKSVHYNIVVNSKSYFLYNATRLSRFRERANYFVWIDAGYGHGDKNVIPHNCHWKPTLLDGFITVIQITPKHDKISRYKINDLYRVDLSVVSGGFFGGDVATIDRFHRFYMKTFFDLLDENKVDDDQTVLTIMMTNFPRLFNVLYSSGRWFDLFNLYPCQLYS